MKRYIHFCPRCSYFKVVESDNIDNIIKCIKCGQQMKPMRMTEDQWKAKSKEEQIDIVKNIKLKYISDNHTVQHNASPKKELNYNQNSLNQDDAKDIIRHLAMIRRNTDTIKNILLFFFIIFLIEFIVAWFPVIFK